MSLAELLAEEAVVVHYTDTTDPYGNITRGVASRTTWPARLEQLTADEILQDQDTIIATWRAFLPADAVVSAYDQIEAHGHTFEVTGLPNVLRTPRGPHHQELRLRAII